MQLVRRFGLRCTLWLANLLIFEIEVVEVKPEPKKDEAAKGSAKAEDEGDDSIAAESLYPDSLDDEDDEDAEATPTGDDEEVAPVK